ISIFPHVERTARILTQGRAVACRAESVTGLPQSQATSRDRKPVATRSGIASTAPVQAPFQDRVARTGQRRRPAIVDESLCRSHLPGASAGTLAPSPRLPPARYLFPV